MPSGFDHVSPGGTLRSVPAPVWNAMLDAAKAYRQGGQGFAAGPGRDRAGGPVLVRNDSGEDCAQFDVLGIDGVVIAPADNESEFRQRVALAGIIPSADDHWGRFVVLQEPIPNGGCGLGMVTGATVARVDVQNANDWYADVADGNRTQLKSAADYGAARLLWKEAGTGTKWAVVRLGAYRNQADFWAEITGATDLGNNRWSYSFKQKYKNGAGYGAWADWDGGVTGTAYNSIEDMNSGSGVQGNGVDVANLDTADYTFTLQPAPTGLIVRMAWVWDYSNETWEYWFAYENGVDGTCD